MGDCSIFVDEAGDQGGVSRYYALTLVFHDQSLDIRDSVARYESSLRDRSLPDIPMHASPLMNGHDAYEGMDLALRKRLFSSFFVLMQHLPFHCRSFVYKRSEFTEPAALSARMRRDVVTLFFDGLGYFQTFDKIKVYYDNGQAIVGKSLRDAVSYALSKEGVVYRDPDPSTYRLLQVADVLCTLELTAMKYAAHEQTATDEKMFGSAGSFRNNYMKAIKRMRLKV